VTKKLLAGYRTRAQEITRTPQPAGTNT
jgi:hypothetical protein